METVRLGSGRTVDLDTWPLESTNQFMVINRPSGVELAFFVDDLTDARCLARIQLSDAILPQFFATVMDAADAKGFDRASMRRVELPKSGQEH